MLYDFNMAEPANISRRWFQIHLSTAILMSCVALLWLATDFGPLSFFLGWMAVASDGLPLLIGVAAIEISIVLLFGIAWETAQRRREARKP